MGCALQTGCLGPKSKVRQVYIDIVQAIYQEAKQIQELSHANHKTSVVIFDIIKARILKKSLTKKLIDNLISHQGHISDCIKQNQEICINSSSSIQRITSLLIVDTVLNEISMSRHISQSITETEENSITDKTNNILTNITPRQNTQTLIVFKKSDSKMDNRIDFYILNQIIYLFQTQTQLYIISVNILLKYLTNRIQKLYHKNEIYRIFTILVQTIQNQKHVTSSVKLFSLLLIKIKGNIRQEESDQRYIHFFMNKYLKYYKQVHNTTISQKEVAEIFFITAKPKEVYQYKATQQLKVGNQTKTVKQQQYHSKYKKQYTLQRQKQTFAHLQQILIIILQILQSFLNKYFTQHLIIYESLLICFDEHQFDLNNITIIWRLIEKIIKKLDYQNHFIQGFFLNLLDYNLFNHDFQQRNSFYYLKQFNHHKYANIASKTCKINCFKLIKYWIIQKNIDINQIILYTCPNILRCYVQNYIYFNKITPIKESQPNNMPPQENIKHQILQIFSFVNEKQFYLIINHIISALVQYNQILIKQTILVQLLSQIIQQNKIYANNLYLETDIINNLSQFQNIQIIIKIIIIIKNNLKQIENKIIQIKIQQDQHIKLSSLLFNLYKLIIQNQWRYSQEGILYNGNIQKDFKIKVHGFVSNMRELVEQTCNIIKILISKGYIVLIIAYIKSINQAVFAYREEEIDEKRAVRIYFVDYLIKSVIFIFNKNQKIPQEMIKINLKIQQNSQNKNLIIDFSQALTKIVLQQQEKIIIKEKTKLKTLTLKDILNSKIVLESNNKRIEATKQFLMIKGADYNQLLNSLRIILSLKLGPIIKRESQTFFNEQKGLGQRYSESLCSDETNLENNYSKQNLDESFRDIIEKIQLG